MSSLTLHYPQFFTATILEWKHLLKPDKYKDIIIEGLSYRVKEKQIFVYGFVVMPNHMHIIWQIWKGYERESVQRDFLKYTAQTMIRDLKVNHPEVLKYLKVNAKDRTHQIWETQSIKH
jgi:putative transposase